MKCNCLSLSSVVERNHEIEVSDLDGEKVMMDLDKGTYFMLNEVGSAIWELIGQKISVAQVVESLRTEYDVEASECEEAVTEYLHNLHHGNLIVIH